MRVFLDAAACKQADEEAMQRGIPSPVLMERAAYAVVEEIRKRDFDLSCPVVLCGTGNNGGDGAAAARILSEMGYRPKVILFGDPEKYSDQLQLQLHILSSRPAEIIHCRKKEDLKACDSATVLIDALFGIGLHRDLAGLFAEAVRYINRLNRPVIAVDIPSGVNTDTGVVCGAAVKACLTVTFTCGKPGLFLFPGTIYAGEIVIREIGIRLPENLDRNRKLYNVEETDLSVLPERDESGNKGTFHKVLCITGSPDICGASFLSAKAALRTGVGMVKIYTSENNRIPLNTLIPEALLSVYGEKQWEEDRLLRDMDWADIILIGCGMGTGKTALKILKTFLENNHKPTVMDADALNLLAEHRELMRQPDFPCIITPHIGELSRLLEVSVQDLKENLVSIVSRSADESGVVFLAKDARSVVAEPNGRVYLTTSGNSALATAGSGDVLAGITAGLLARVPEHPLAAAALSAFIHGRCGTLAAEDRSEASVNAADLLDYIQRFS